MTMALSSSAIIIIVIMTAIAFVVIGLSIHRMITETSVEVRPASQSTETYPQDQLKYMQEVRWRTQAAMWEVAKRWRKEQGMSIPDWEPGQERGFPCDESVSRTPTDGSRSAFMLRANSLEQDVVRNSCNIDESRQRSPRNETPDTDEDEWGMPKRGAPIVKHDVPEEIVRWTQYGTPRLSQVYPQITLNDNSEDIVDGELIRPEGTLNGPWRTSSVYSEQPPHPPHSPRRLTASPIPLLTVPHAMPEESLFQPLDSSQMRSASNKSQVHTMIEQWERANGAFSESK